MNKDQRFSEESFSTTPRVQQVDMHKVFQRDIGRIKEKRVEADDLNAFERKIDGKEEN